jgi:hypothetical protein
MRKQQIISTSLRGRSPKQSRNKDEFNGVNKIVSCVLNYTLYKPPRPADTPPAEGNFWITSPHGSQ